MSSKIVSKLITHLLQTVIFDEVTPFQFGSNPEIVYPDAVFSLKTILQSRREVDLDTWVVYVDLVKAFDTANHAILEAFLQKMGIPSRVINVIRFLYRDFKMELTIGSEKVIIDYIIGVKQGDNLAPTLFTCHAGDA